MMMPESTAGCVESHVIGPTWWSRRIRTTVAPGQRLGSISRGVVASRARPDGRGCRQPRSNTSTVGDEAADVEDVPDDGIPMPRVIFVIASFFVANLAIAVAHVVWPERVDVLTMVFAEIAVLPLLLLILRRFELGFGEWKFRVDPRNISRSFATLESLEERAESAEPDVAPNRHEPQPMPEPQPNESTTSASIGAGANIQSEVERVSSADDDVVFVRLRRSIESLLKGIAVANDVPLPRAPSASALTDALVRAEILQPSEADALKVLIRAGNAQVHNQPIPAGIAEFARLEAPRLLAALDGLSRPSPRRKET